MLAASSALYIFQRSSRGVRQSFKGTASLRWSPAVKLTQSILLTICQLLLQKASNPAWVFLRVLAGSYLWTRPISPIHDPGPVTKLLLAPSKQTLSLLPISSAVGPSPGVRPSWCSPQGAPVLPGVAQSPFNTGGTGDSSRGWTPLLVSCVETREAYARVLNCCNSR